MTKDTRIIAGRYSLEQLIGRGGMGDVYRGTDTETGDVVAVKLLHSSIVEDNPDIVDRFQREGEALRQLNHPNIVTVREAVEDEGEHFLVMEYISGGSLRDLIDEEARLPIEAVLNVALDLADALTRAHRLHIIHRDIKPDNVLLAEDGTPRLTDFGVAHMGDRTRLTQTGSVIGTYAYLSPEACNGLELDERADIWSFGVMVFEMLTGRVPFHAGGTAAILTAILTKPAPDITRLRPDLPPALVDLIYRMLEKDRERRISSVRLVGAELEAIIRQLDTPLRQKVLEAGHEPTVGSRFVTPPDDEDTRSNVPAMERSTPQHTHGFSLYPGQEAPAGQTRTSPSPFTPPAGNTGYYTPGGSPMTTAELAAAQAFTRKWQLITLMVIVTVLACSTVAVLALILGPTDEGGDETDQAIDTSITVPPVEPNESMVLVAELEALDEEDRSITRYIRDDLTHTIEQGVTFSNVRIRAYPATIASQQQAEQIAETYGAAVVVWGSYTDVAIDVRVSVGTSTSFPATSLPLDTIQQSANVRVTMTDARNESIAPQVLGALGAVQGGTGDIYAIMRTMATLDAIDVAAAEVTGATVAAYTQHYFEIYTTDTNQALEAIDQAIDEDVSNPLSHTLRSLALHRLGRIDEAHQAAETAARLAGPNWTVPLVLMSSSVDDPNEQLAYLSQVISLRPDDWYTLTSRGALYYIYGETELARADLDAAIALEPDSNFPYTFAALIAMSYGRFEEATGYIRIIVQEYPDPDLYARAIDATVGEQDIFSDAVSAFVNLILGRYVESAASANAAL
ncbi:MAG: protein kinase, partial [Anaerolineae bacterium]|nr:protein kinase [Anaerolineae bacterium]